MKTTVAASERGAISSGVSERIRTYLLVHPPAANRTTSERNERRSIAVALAKHAPADFPDHFA